MSKNVVLIVAIVVFLIIGYIIGIFFPVNNLSNPQLESEIDTFAYSVGYDQGNSLLNYLEQMDIQDEFSNENFMAGVEDGFESDESVLDQQQRQMGIQQYVMKLQQKAQEKRSEDAAENLQKGMDFLAENKEKEGVVTTESGLQYEVLEEGSGASPNADDTVVVHYTGKLIDGTEFDSSVSRGEPATFPLDQVIPGWTEAIQLMKEGGKYRFYIPANLAYGERGSGPNVPPNSVLIFDVELLEVKK